MYLSQVWCIWNDSEARQSLVSGATTAMNFNGTVKVIKYDCRKGEREKKAVKFYLIILLPHSILPLNIVNEKTYIFIWFWYLILVVMLCGLLIYRLLIIFVPSVRSRVLNARNRMVPREIAVSVTKKVDIGDWWIIYMLGRNLDPIIFRDVLAELAKTLPSNKKRNN